MANPVDTFNKMSPAAKLALVAAIGLTLWYFWSKRQNSSSSSGSSGSGSSSSSGSGTTTSSGYTGVVGAGSLQGYSSDSGYNAGYDQGYSDAETLAMSSGLAGAGSPYTGSFALPYSTTAGSDLTIPTMPSASPPINVTVEGPTITGGGPPSRPHPNHTHLIRHKKHPAAPHHKPKHVIVHQRHRTVHHPVHHPVRRPAHHPRHVK